jgi:hypothetical protein
MSFPSIYLPCGSKAHFDHESGISYRCSSCFAVVGSMGQPSSCKEEAKMWETLEALGGRGWDYETGAQKEKGKVDAVD